jgi:hypothetical protein
MNCPQCGTGLGEGAKACATCGWSASRKTLWIVLGCVFGFLFLVCCGAGTWFWFKIRKAVEAVQTDIVPLQIAIYRAQVVNYAKVRGTPPATLEEAGGVPLKLRSGQNLESNQRATDVWQNPYRFEMKPDRTFEVRSAGPDKAFDTPDDLHESGSLDDDLEALQTNIHVLSQKMGESVIRAFGFDPDRLQGKHAGPEPVPPPAPPPDPGPPPPPPPAPPK